MTRVARRAAALSCALLLLAGAASAAAPAPAPQFALRTFDGKTVTLRGLRGKVVALLFWAPT